MSRGATVALQRRRVRTRQRPVLIAYDGSEQAKAIEAGRVLGAGLVVLTVRASIEELRFRRAGAAPRARPARPFRQCGTRRKPDAGAVAEEGRTWPVRPGRRGATGCGRAGAPAGDRRAVDALEADVIAIGSPTGLSKVLLGSVASAVAQHSGRSVLLVHPDTKEPGATR
ncbi:MAG: universal stress protein [Solirubrobacterales bacterium]